jgi:hypothetical protein
MVIGRQQFFSALSAWATVSSALMLLMTNSSEGFPRTRVSFVANASAAEFFGGYLMTQSGTKGHGPEVAKTQNKKQNNKNDVVITPAGPIPKDKVHEIKPNETIRRNEDGSYTIVPKGQ